jgi:hypothetical protein
MGARGPVVWSGAPHNTTGWGGVGGRYLSPRTRFTSGVGSRARVWYVWYVCLCGQKTGSIFREEGSVDNFHFIWRIPRFIWRLPCFIGTRRAFVRASFGAVGTLYCYVCTRRARCILRSCLIWSVGHAGSLHLDAAGTLDLTFALYLERYQVRTQKRDHARHMDLDQITMTNA